MVFLRDGLFSSAVELHLPEASFHETSCPTSSIYNTKQLVKTSKQQRFFSNNEQNSERLHNINHLMYQ